MDGITHISVPGFDVWCMNDGAYVFDDKVFPSVDAPARDARLADAGQSQIDTVFHAYLIRPNGGEYLLFDTGCGTGFGDIAGHLVTRLAALNIQADDIKQLVFSHLHSDHCGGAVVDGQAVFAAASVTMHDNEPGVWDGETAAANQVLDLYQGQMRTIADGGLIAPGIRAWFLPGHTAGHMGLRIGSHLVLCGDIMHSDALQFPDPDVASIYDDDPDLARVTRKAALNEIAQNDLIFSGSHGCHMDKFRRLRVDGAGFTTRPL
jgi:glyoxylase-like metal-dependent hydrolase (beta-lactamase superfamily II)